MSDKKLPSENPSAAPSLDSVGWEQISWLPCDVCLELPLAEFRVRDLLQLENGSIVRTRCGRGVEIPLQVNGQVIGWAEFEPLGDHIAVRVTELDYERYEKHRAFVIEVDPTAALVELDEELCSQCKPTKTAS
jgi:flagellar motor switch/type III secretory pathway protein FliN